MFVPTDLTFFPTDKYLLHPINCLHYSFTYWIDETIRFSYVNKIANTLIFLADDANQFAFLSFKKTWILFCNF